MARKSRKNINLVKEESKKIYKAGGYVRLSVAKENGKYSSIENQKQMIINHIAKHTDIQFEGFYCDENTSGTTVTDQTKRYFENFKMY